MYRTILVTALLLPFAFGNAAAHGLCAHGEESGAIALGPYYLLGTNVYEETNTHPGLQLTGGQCEDDSGRIVRWSADTKVL